MKKLKYIFLLAGALSLASCESWLDEDPQYTINLSSTYKCNFLGADNKQ